MGQRAILLLLEPIYETDFLPCSYGFRSGRSAHDALHVLRNGFIEQGLRWVVDVNATDDDQGIAFESMALPRDKYCVRDIAVMGSL